MSRRIVTRSADGGTSDGGGATATAPTVYVPTLKTYTFYDYEVDGALSSVSAQFEADMGIAQDNILRVEIVGTNVQSTSAWQMHFYPLNTSGAEQNGYMGFSFNGIRGSGSHIYSTSHNSNAKYIWWPMYTSVYDANSYGSGMTFDFRFPVNSISSTNKALQMGGSCHYQQNTSYNYPNLENFSWDNYSNDDPYPSIHGIKLKPNSGSFTGGNILIKIWHKG